MACGTGKTFTTLWIKEKLQAKSTLILLPSLSLLSQTLREWTSACNEPFEALCLCSDETVGTKPSDDELVESVKDISFPVTTKADEVESFLRKRSKKVIFSTYQSSPIIAEAQSKPMASKFDLVIADEAHRCTGEVGNTFTTVLDDKKIKAQKRLFATATPRTYSSNLKKKASERGVEVTGMNDESVFGKPLYELNFGEAINRELLTDYQVVIVGVDEPMIAEWIRNREIVRTEKGDTTDAKSLSAQIGLIKAIRDYDLKRMISFHSRVKRAEEFSQEIHSSIDIVSKEKNFDGDLWADYVSGSMSTHNRRIKLEQLKELNESKRGLLSNARCLAEGVDVPSLDGVAFIDPKSSQVDIVQAVGRSIRLSKEKTVGTIVLPVFIEDGDDPDSSIQSSHFKPVWLVLNALKSHDEKLSFELDKLRTKLGRENSLGNKKGAFSKIVFDLPITVNQSFANSLRTYLVEKTTSSWSWWFGLLQSYFNLHGKSQVPARDGYLGHNLGYWVSRQRKNYNLLNIDQKKQLESFYDWQWDVFSSQWNNKFSYLEEYVNANGDSLVPFEFVTKDGIKLGVWVGHQRRNKQHLTEIQKIKLESLSKWSWDVLEDGWNTAFIYLKTFSEKYLHTYVPNKYKTDDGFALGSWVLRQRSNKNLLAEEYIRKLDNLKYWKWDNYKESQWEESFKYLQEFVEEYGTSEVPQNSEFYKDFNLGYWVSWQRGNKTKLNNDQIQKLEKLKGWTWNAFDSKWDRAFFLLKQFATEHGHCLVPTNCKTIDGFSLGSWVIQQRVKKDNLPEDRLQKLESIEGWVWNVLEYQWEIGFAHLSQYFENNGDVRVKNAYITSDGYKLGRWLSTQKYNWSKVDKEKQRKLVALGFNGNAR